MVSAPAADTAWMVGVDWGSSNVRVSLIRADGRVIGERSSSAGASVISAGHEEFGAALEHLLQGWPEDLPVLCCGMVGSKHGWREAAYVDCPATADALAQSVVAVPWRRRQVGIVPGVRCRGESGVPDLLRGEETQAVGVGVLRPGLEMCIVMPGTHSKWASFHGGMVRSFATYMTGELFAILQAHSVLARLFEPSAELADDAFGAGVIAARDHGDLGLQHQLFAVRSLGLERRMPGSALCDYMSGLLIGHEVRAGLGWAHRTAASVHHFVLVGEPALSSRYRKAFALFNVSNVESHLNTAPLGLWAMAKKLWSPGEE